MAKKDVNRLKIMLAVTKHSNKWLAEMLGKDQATISKWCTNTCQPDLETLIRISDLLKVDVNDLLNKECIKEWWTLYISFSLHVSSSCSSMPLSSAPPTCTWSGPTDAMSGHAGWYLQVWRDLPYNISCRCSWGFVRKAMTWELSSISWSIPHASSLSPWAY